MMEKSEIDLTSDQRREVAGTLAWIVQRARHIRQKEEEEAAAVTDSEAHTAAASNQPPESGQHHLTSAAPKWEGG